MGMFTLALTLAAAPPLQKPDNQAVGQSICMDQRVDHAVAELIGTWSQGYAFARVIIGTDGRFGEITAPSTVERGPGYVLCRGGYQLTKSGTTASIMSYVTRIDHVTFRVIDNGGGYNVSLVDLPDHLDGSDAATAALITRFTINGRPYADILRENQQRLTGGNVGSPRIGPAAWINGSWVLAARGGDDGRTVCGDFSRYALERTNGGTGTILTFDADGRYRSASVFIDSRGVERASNDEKRWAIRGDQVAFTSLPVRIADLPPTRSETYLIPAARVSENVMRFDTARFVRCTGAVDEIYGF